MKNSSAGRVFAVGGALVLLGVGFVFTALFSYFIRYSQVDRQHRQRPLSPAEPNVRRRQIPTPHRRGLSHWSKAARFTSSGVHVSPTPRRVPSEHELLLVHTRASVWDWGITFDAILGIIGVTLFLTARLDTRRAWHILP